MAKFKVALVALAAVGLAGCTADQAATSASRMERAEQRTGLVPLLDNTGSVAVFVPESQVRGLAQGSPFVVNRGGQLQTLTVGARQEGGVSAGAARVVGTDSDGRPVIMRDTPGQGDLSPTGIPVVVGTDSDGRPIIRFMSPTEAAAFQRQAAGGAPRGQRTPTALPPRPATSPASVPR
jgi:hypothetical protein